MDHRKIEVLQHFDYNKTFYFGKVVPFNRLYELTTLRVSFVEIDIVDSFCYSKVNVMSVIRANKPP